MNGGTGTDKVTYAGRSAAVYVTLWTDSAAATGAATTTPIPAVCTDSDGGNLALIVGTVDMTGLTFPLTGTLDITVGTTSTTVTFTAAANAAAIVTAINTAVSAITASLDGSNQLNLLLDDATSTSALDVTGGDQETAFGLNAATAVTNESDKTINIEWLTGGDGADTLTGHTAGETIEGGAAADTISGGAGDDTLFGDAAGDTLDGQAGNDTLYGGAGADSSTGGSGDADVCEYVTGTDVAVASDGCEVHN